MENLLPSPQVNENSCSSRLSASEYWSLSVHKVEKQIQTEMTFAEHDSCIANRYITVDDGSLSENLVRAEDRIRNMQAVPEDFIPKEWENTAYFRKEWITKIFEHQKDLLPAEKIKNQVDLRVWFIYYFNENNPKESTYGCRLCRDYYDKFGLALKYKSKLADPKGTLKISKQANSDQINQHPKSPGHLSIIQKLKEAQENKLSKVMNAVQWAEEEKNYEVLQVTANMMKTIYAEVRMNIPFMYHPYMVELLKLHGAKVGYHHKDKRSAIRMIEVMSNEMHDMLLNALTEKNYPCSLIVDTSTSIGLYHYLTVLIQTLENERPVVYFYRLIEVGKDSSAVGLMNAFADAVHTEKIDVTRYFKHNLVGFGADGASVNMGSRGGFIKKLEEFVGNRAIYAVWCIPHRLELSVKHALTENPDMNFVDDTITLMTNFYNSRSYKRKEHLRNQATITGSDLYELHFAFRQRWVMSDYTAVRAVVKAWKLLVEDLQIMQTEDDFRKDWDIAIGIENKLTKRQFVLGIHFFLDLLNSLKTYSVIAQQSAGILIGKEQFRKDLVNLPLSLINNEGSFTTLLLRDAVCKGKEGNVCTVEEFLNLEDVVYKEIALSKDQNSHKFLTQKNNFLESLTTEINKYFPEGSFEDFDIFVPKNMPRDRNSALTYGCKEIQNIATRFNYDPEIAGEDWKQLLLSMLEQDEYCTSLQKSPESFWPSYLRKTNLNWGTTIKLIVRTVLVLPANSADAERSFSIMNHIKYDRRASLNSETLDYLMRLRINGPKQLDRFASAKYAKAWVNQGHLRTDDPSQQRKRKIAEVDDDDEDGEDTGKIFMQSELY